jgi:hypothetical protein
MKAHTLIYFTFFGLSYDRATGWHDYIQCTMPDCHEEAVDINHIEPRGMGGTGKKDIIENLIAVCRSCHVANEGINKQEQRKLQLTKINDYESR